MNYLTTNMTIIFLLVFAGNVFALVDKDMGGTVEATVNGKVLHFPSLKTDIKTNIQGDLATVTLTQTFANPTTVALNATYLFPLNKDAAVHAMTMEVGDEIIQAQIEKIEEAKKKFEKAKNEGKAASLLTQHRPNMFTQDIANLMPDMPIKVTLVYDQIVPKVDGDYELVIPLVVGPRYQPAKSGKAPAIIDEGVNIGKEKVSSTTSFNQWEIEKLPEYPEVKGLSIPDTVDNDRVSIEVNLEAGCNIPNIYSRTHKISITDGEYNKFITLQNGRTIDNRDFVLRYQLAGENIQPAFLTHGDAKEGYFSLMIEPPATPNENEILSREMVFVLDTSGSMHGQPIEASKVFMSHALKNLRSSDYFRVIRFSNNASEFTSGPVRATPGNIKNGLRYVNSLRAGGGTEVPNAIDQAFSVDQMPGTMRIVVFLTDGYIGNESHVLNMISDSIGDARIYSFGVGTSVNRFLLSEMGRMGRGFARFIDPTEDVQDVAIQLANKLESPVLTDIKIDWGDLEVSGTTPSIIPDLFAGDSLRILGKVQGDGTHTVTINGRVRGSKASMPIEATIGDVNGKDNESPIPHIWARSQIADHMRQINTPAALKNTDLNNDELKQEVIKLGLKHSLATRWTSFIAVSQKVVNDNPEDVVDSQVPLPIVKGVTSKAYGNKTKIHAMKKANPHMQLAQNFHGNAVPEPSTWAGLAIITLAALMFFMRRKTA